MNPHGEYKIEVMENILHVFPVGGFNAQGIEELHNDVAKKAPKNRAWALFEHPFNHAGLTPEAVDEIINCYQRLSQTNCVAVALEISSTWQGIFEKLILEKVKIPVYLDSRPEILEQKIKEELSKVS